MSQDSAVQGTCDPRFDLVKQTFAEGFRSRGEVGAAVAVTVDGKPVVDLFGGFADQAKTRRWTRTTVANVYSTTKGMTAICAHRLAAQGKLDLDAPVARYWPEFAATGKERMPVRWLLSHRAGLAAVEEILPGEALYDWGAMTGALAAQKPWWTPGEAHGYHAVTFGWLVGEVVRRVTGKSLGTYFREEIAGPLGADFQIGLPDHDHDRAAEMSTIPPPPPGDDLPGLVRAMMKDPGGVSARAFMNPPSMALGVNHRAWRSAEIPAANGHADARAIARIYGALACGGTLDGVSLFGPEQIAVCHAEQSHGDDLVLHVPTRFGAGFMISQDRPDARFGRGPRAFGHPGAGGSVGFADPDGRVGFGYVMNRMGPNILLDPRAIALIDALYDCL